MSVFGSDDRSDKNEVFHIGGIPALIALLFLIFIFLVIIWLISKFLTYNLLQRLYA